MLEINPREIQAVTTAPRKARMAQEEEESNLKAKQAQARSLEGQIAA